MNKEERKTTKTDKVHVIYGSTTGMTEVVAADTIANTAKDAGATLVGEVLKLDETSATAMFAYAFAEGAKAGVLGDEYRTAAKRAYAALVPRLDEHGNLPDVCVGTGWTNDRHHYLTHPKANGDPHGQAPLLWLCRALAER